jgi:hypothetical protein
MTCDDARVHRAWILLALLFVPLGCSQSECSTCGVTSAKPDTGDAGVDTAIEDTGCATKNACGGCAEIGVTIGACCGANLCLKCQGTETFRCTSCPDSGC